MILESTRILTMKIGEVVDIQGNYKILRLKFWKKLSISFNSQISAHALFCDRFGYNKSKNFRG
jgi:hypothetical protein